MQFGTIQAYVCKLRQPGPWGSIYDVKEEIVFFREQKTNRVNNS